MGAVPQTEIQMVAALKASIANARRTAGLTPLELENEKLRTEVLQLETMLKFAFELLRKAKATGVGVGGVSR